MKRKRVFVLVATIFTLVFLAGSSCVLPARAQEGPQIKWVFRWREVPTEAVPWVTSRVCPTEVADYIPPDGGSPSCFETVTTLSYPSVGPLGTVPWDGEKTLGRWYSRPNDPGTFVWDDPASLKDEVIVWVYPDTPWEEAGKIATIGVGTSDLGPVGTLPYNWTPFEGPLGHWIP